MNFFIKRLNLHYTRDITAPKRVTSGGIHLRGLAPGQHSSEETSQRWRAVGDTVLDFTGPGFDPTTSGIDCGTFVLPKINLSECLVQLMRANKSKQRCSALIVDSNNDFFIELLNAIDIFAFRF